MPIIIDIWKHLHPLSPKQKEVYIQSYPNTTSDATNNMFDNFFNTLCSKGLIKLTYHKIGVHVELYMSDLNPRSPSLFHDFNVFNPIRSGLFQTVNDPGGGGFKSPPPYDLENYYVNLHHIIHVNFTRCFWHDPVGIFQKFAILTILQRFQNKK